MLIRRTASLAAVVGLELLALVLLHRVGSYGPTAIDWHDPGGWLAATAPEDVVVSIVRVAALALTWWLLASTALYAVARATCVPALIRSVEWATLPSVRRLLDGVATSTIVAGSMLGGSGVAGAAPADRSPVVVTLDADGATTTTVPSYHPRPAGDVLPTSTTPQPQPTVGTPDAAKALPREVQDERPSATVPGAPAIYVVEPGDNIWTIAARQITSMTGRSDHEMSVQHVGDYWVRLQEANRDRLRSGDPDLIFAGEELILP